MHKVYLPPWTWVGNEFQDNKTQNEYLNTLPSHSSIKERTQYIIYESKMYNQNIAKD